MGDQHPNVAIAARRGSSIGVCASIMPNVSPFVCVSVIMGIIHIIIFYSLVHMIRTSREHRLHVRQKSHTDIDRRNVHCKTIRSEYEHGDDTHACIKIVRLQTSNERKLYEGVLSTATHAQMQTHKYSTRIRTNYEIITSLYVCV